MIKGVAAIAHAGRHVVGLFDRLSVVFDVALIRGLQLCRDDTDLENPELTIVVEILTVLIILLLIRCMLLVCVSGFATVCFAERLLHVGVARLQQVQAVQPRAISPV